ncbi:MAG: YegS/Rv2252/BmrU family lipid kinase [Planctomycetes bacterium]|nr:YegS/Rv2252/BmrU family lipid kinase [Planctomycetota bacterium]
MEGKRKILIIANPTAGSGKGESRARKLHSEISSLGGDVELFLTSKQNDAREKAALEKERFDAIVVVGGDGTIREVVTALLGSETPMGVFPVGTANMMAREFHLPFRESKAARVIMDGFQIKVDIGRANGEIFSLVSGVGFDGSVVHEISRLRGKGTLPGMHAYVLPVLKAFLKGDIHCLNVWIDGRFVAEKANLVIVTNAKNYAGLFEIGSFANPSDGFFDICVFTESIRLGFFKYVILAFLRRLPAASGVKYFRGRTIEVSTSGGESVPYQLDGDPGGITPVVFEMLHEGINLLVPREL